MSALIVGCGYLGFRVAKAWVASGRQVFALTRGRAELMRSHGIEPIVGDVLDPNSLRQLPSTDTVLYAVGLDRAAGKSMREVYVNGLRNVLQRLPAKPRLLYVSSTSVYGQCDGSWVDESSEMEPREESGRVVLEAEQTLRAERADSVILRFAGIYGADRILRKTSLMQGEPVPGDADRFLNLIHVEDGTRAVLAADARAIPGESYLIADDEPPTRREFFTHLASAIGAPAPTFEASPASATEANRRIRNTKAKRDLLFTPQYPSFRTGVLSEG
jgi:nucleoside-diphosphate-sugar epimerase